MFRRLCIIFVLIPPALGQIAVDGIQNMANTSPVAPGTTLTGTILNNGTFGNTMTSGWSITGSGLTVGMSDPRCSILTPLTIGSTTYNFEVPSQAVQLNGSNNFSYAQANFSSSKQHVLIRACVTFGGAGNATNLQDMFAVLALNGGGAWMQQFSGANGINIESDHNTTHHSPVIKPLNSKPYFVLFMVDYSAPFPGVANSGTATLAIFDSVFPYAQLPCTPVGAGCTAAGTVSIDVKNTAEAGSLVTFREGNAETGTSTSPLKFEMVSWDYTTTTFPSSIGTIGTPWEGLLAASRAIDWSGAGAGVIPPRTNICSTVNAGANLTTTINNAIAACPSGQAVKLGAGTFTGLGTLVGKNGVTLRGSGADQTTLQFTSTSGCTSSTPPLVCMGGTDNNFKTSPSNLVNWTAGYLAGSNVITLASVPNLKVGNPIILDQLDDTCDTGGIIVSQSNTTCTPTSPGISGPYSLEGNGGGSQRSGRQQMQIVQVVACGGVSTPGASCSGTNVAVTINPPLHMPNWSSSKTPQAWWATSPALAQGIEDLTLDPNGQSGLGILWKNAYGNWAKGIEILATDRAHIQTLYGAHNTVQDSYFFLTQNAATQSYGWECFSGSDNLIVNNIFHAIEGAMKENGACVGDVLAYNYTTNPYYTPSAGWNQPSWSDHTAGTAFILSEGNVGKGHEADVFHGTHHFSTDFRNYYLGKSPACYASGASYATATYGACNANLHAFRIESFSRGFNAIGNVLSFTGGGFSYSGAQPNIFEIGFGNTSSVTVPDDPITTSTFLRWFNWDSVNQTSKCTNSEVPSGLTAGTQQPFLNAIPASCSAPASFAYTSQPSWWPTSKIWPPIGPDVTGGNISNVGGHAYTIPAQDCATLIGIPADGTGPVRPFNPVNCYQIAPPQIPAPSAINFARAF